MGHLGLVVIQNDDGTRIFVPKLQGDRPKYLSKAGKIYSSIHHMIERMEEKRRSDGLNGIEFIVKRSLLFLDTFYHGMDGNIVLTVPALDRYFGRNR